MTLVSNLLKQELDLLLGAGVDNGEEVAYFCPLCIKVGKTPDVKGKLYVNFKKRSRPDVSPGVFFCFRCESAGSIQWLFRSMGITLAEKTPTAQAFQNAIKLLHHEGEGAVVIESEQVVDHTNELAQLGCHLVKRGEPEYEYLEARGLTHEDMRHYKILTGAGRYFSRVIVPTFDREIVPFFVARAIKEMYFNTSDGKVNAPKYLNPKGEARRNCIFNLDKVEDEMIIVTEGVFSAMAIGRNAVATFGKLITQKQINMLVAAAKSKEIIICLDGDAHSEGINLAIRLESLGANVSVVLLPPGCDPADLPKNTSIHDYLKKRWKYSIPSLLEKQLAGEFVVTRTIDSYQRREVGFARSVEQFLKGTG